MVPKRVTPVLDVRVYGVHADVLIVAYPDQPMTVGGDVYVAEPRPLPRPDWLLLVYTLQCDWGIQSFG
jgi:hypothetical protein